MGSRKMEELREFINTMIVSDNCDRDQLLEKSQELDKLILEEVKKNVYAKKMLGNELVSEFYTIVDKLQSIEHVYDVIRIVHPVKKEVLELKEGILHKKDFKCFDFWEKQDSCENCISTKAYNEDNVFIKTEYNRHKTYIVIAVPIFIYDKKLVVELLKDTTNSLVIQNGEA